MTDHRGGDGRRRFSDKVPAFEMALEIENTVFTKIGNEQTNADYRAKVRSLSLNLKDKNNPGLRQGVLDGQIDPSALVTMTPEQMASDTRKAERQRLMAQNLFNARAAEPQEAETDMFECSRCHQRKVRYFEKQTRSADEPMTGTFGSACCMPYFFLSIFAVRQRL